MTFMIRRHLSKARPFGPFAQPGQRHLVVLVATLGALCAAPAASAQTTGYGPPQPTAYAAPAPNCPAYGITAALPPSGDETEFGVELRSGEVFADNDQTTVLNPPTAAPCVPVHPPQPSFSGPPRQYMAPIYVLAPVTVVPYGPPQYRAPRYAAPQFRTAQPLRRVPYGHLPHGYWQQNPAAFYGQPVFLPYPNPTYGAVSVRPRQVWIGSHTSRY